VKLFSWFDGAATECSAADLISCCFFYMYLCMMTTPLMSYAVLFMVSDTPTWNVYKYDDDDYYY